MNDFGCLARERNLAGVFNVAVPFTSKRRLMSYFIISEGAFNFARVAISALSNANIEIHEALWYSVVVAMRMQIFTLYVYSSVLILSLTLDPE